MPGRRWRFSVPVCVVWSELQAQAIAFHTSALRVRQEALLPVSLLHLQGKAQGQSSQAHAITTPSGNDCVAETIKDSTTALIFK